MKKVAKILFSISFLFSVFLSNIELAEAKGSVSRSSSSSSSSVSRSSSSSSSSSYSKPSTSTSTTPKTTTPSAGTTTPKTTTPSTGTTTPKTSTTPKTKLTSNPTLNKSNITRSTNYGTKPAKIKVSNSATNALLFYLIFFGNDADGNAVYANESETEFYTYDEIVESDDVLLDEEYAATNSNETNTSEIIDEVDDLVEEVIEEEDYEEEIIEEEDNYEEKQEDLGFSYIQYFILICLITLTLFGLAFFISSRFKSKK